jgi:hypothetical protein
MRNFKNSRMQKRLKISNSREDKKYQKGKLITGLIFGRVMNNI